MRTSAEELQVSAVQALIEACSEVDVEVAVGEEASILRVGPSGDAPVDLQVQGRAVVSGDVAVADGGSSVVVADVVTASARESLRDQGVGWLDRRGHLRLVVDQDQGVVRRRQQALCGGRSGGRHRGLVRWWEGSRRGDICAPALEKHVCRKAGHRWRRRGRCGFMNF